MKLKVKITDKGSRIFNEGEWNISFEDAAEASDAIGCAVIEAALEAARDGITIVKLTAKLSDIEVEPIKFIVEETTQYEVIAQDHGEAEEIYLDKGGAFIGVTERDIREV